MYVDFAIIQISMKEEKNIPHDEVDTHCQTW